MVQRVEVEVDDQGRIAVPSAVRDRLELTPGTTLVVEQEADTTYLRVRVEHPRLVEKQGVLVVEGEVLGDIVDPVRRERDARVEYLMRQAAP
ncbi:MAG TPA: AbrB/MazE/SpoVT family DNA-binding domain-containing protein [Planctomycetaceae bacterium]